MAIVWKELPRFSGHRNFTWSDFGSKDAGMARGYCVGEMRCCHIRHGPDNNDEKLWNLEVLTHVRTQYVSRPTDGLVRVQLGVTGSEKSLVAHKEKTFDPQRDWNKERWKMVLRIPTQDLKDGSGLHFAIDVDVVRQVCSEPLPAARLRRLLLGDDSLDVHFLAFSRRSRVIDEFGGIRATCPRAVLANAEFLCSSSSYFKAMLRGGFAEPSTRNTNGGVVDFSAPYDYQSDSDLDEDEDNDDDSDCLKAPPPAKKRKIKSSGRRSKSSFPDERSHRLDAPKIQIKDTAHRTCAALIFYLYTHEVYFAPLTSTLSGGTCLSILRNETSPKSMYRLADKLDMEDLAKKSMESLESQLNERNIVQELFSDFTARFPVVRDMEIRVALQHWNEIKSSEAMQKKITAARTTKMSTRL